MLFELLMAVFMEKHTAKSSANSSLPASQSPDDATARSRPGAKGKGPASNEARAANTRTRTYVAELRVESCARCGEDLTDTACTGHERRTLIDIVFEKVVRHTDAKIKHCPRCRTETRARFPDEMPGPLQYGPGIKAYAVHLLVAQMLSLKRVAQSMHALIGRVARQRAGSGRAQCPACSVVSVADSTEIEEVVSDSFDRRFERFGQFSTTNIETTRPRWNSSSRSTGSAIAV